MTTSINSLPIGPQLSENINLNANELNILAEKEMLDFIKKGIYEDFLDQIVLEVGLIEV